MLEFKSTKLQFFRILQKKKQFKMPDLANSFHKLQKCPSLLKSSEKIINVYKLRNLSSPTSKELGKRDWHGFSEWKQTKTFEGDNLVWKVLDKLCGGLEKHRQNNSRVVPFLTLLSRQTKLKSILCPAAQWKLRKSKVVLPF